MAKDGSSDSVECLLGDADRRLYQSMTVHEAFLRVRSAKVRPDGLIGELKMLHQFVCAGTEDRQIRSFVVGIFFCSSMIIVRTNRMARVVGRSKSAINCLLHRAGFVGSREDNNLRLFFSRVFRDSPRIDLCNVHRGWAVRRNVDPNLARLFFTTFPPLVRDEDLAGFAGGSEAAPTPQVLWTRPPEPAQALYDLRNLLSRPLV